MSPLNVWMHPFYSVCHRSNFISGEWRMNQSKRVETRLTCIYVLDRFQKIATNSALKMMNHVQSTNVIRECWFVSSFNTIFCRRHKTGLFNFYKFIPGILSSKLCLKMDSKKMNRTIELVQMMVHSIELSIRSTHINGLLSAQNASNARVVHTLYFIIIYKFKLKLRLRLWLYL